MKQKNHFTLKETVAIFEALGDGDLSELSGLSDSDEDDDESTLSTGRKSDALVPGPSKKDLKSSRPAPRVCLRKQEKARPKHQPKKQRQNIQKRVAKPVDIEPDTDRSTTEEYADGEEVDKNADVVKTDRPKTFCKKKEQRWHQKQFRTSFSDTVWQGSVAAPSQVELPSPFEYFKRYIDTDMYDLAAEQTNLYSLRESGHNVSTTSTEIRQLFALHILIGVLKFPRLRMYWSDATRIPIIANTMSVNRFMKLRTNLHVVVEKPATDDRLWKVRPVIERVMKRCHELDVEENVCIDEQMVPFKGQLDIKQYMQNKPCKWGVKVFLLCGSSGLVYDGMVYQGKTNHLNEELVGTYGVTGAIVVQLSQRLASQVHHKLYADNYFTSLPVIRHFTAQGICYAGTVQQNRLMGCPLSAINKKERGAIEEIVTVEGDIVVTQWMNNRSVLMASNFVGKGSASQVRHWSKTQKDYIQVNRPEVIKLYNASMGGVDKMDFLIQLYRIFIRSRKWTLRVLFRFVTVAVNNSWLEYQRDADMLRVSKKKRHDLYSWTYNIAEAMCKAGLSVQQCKRGRPSHSGQIPAKKQKCDARPISDVRHDDTGHWPEIGDVQQRCKNPGCELRSKFYCVQCALMHQAGH